MKITLSGSVVYEPVPHYEWRPQLPPTHTASSALLQTDKKKETKDEGVK